MLTRCPHCQTAFRVTSEQLKLRQGQVRCGECRGVFNALESLADEAVPAVPPAPAPEIPIVDAADTLPGAIAEIAADVEAESAEPDEVIEEIPAVVPEEESSDEYQDEQTDLLSDASVAESSAAPEEEPREEPPEEPREEPGDAVTAQADAAPVEEPAEEPAAEVLEEPAEEAFEAEAAEELPPHAPRRWPWIAGSVMLALLALLQLLFIYRVELAVLAPELRPLMTGVCDVFGCTVPRPRKPELASIESSDLAPEGKDTLLLTATLKNRAPFDQEYPHLELTLTDARDAAILRKVLTPSDYLPADLPPAEGFSPRGEVAVKLLLEAQGVPAVGYRLYLFYP